MVDALIVLGVFILFLFIILWITYLLEGMF